jgi:hypothetical protein
MPETRRRTLGDDVRRIEISDRQTVRACTPYPPVLDPGINEIGWLFGALKVQGLTAD